MSLSTFVSFQSRFVTYLLTFPRIILTTFASLYSSIQFSIVPLSTTALPRISDQIFRDNEHPRLSIRYAMVTGK